MRQTPDIATYRQSRMPGRSDELLPKRDVWGRSIINEGGIGPDILSPIWTSFAMADRTISAARPFFGRADSRLGEILSGAYLVLIQRGSGLLHLSSIRLNH